MNKNGAIRSKIAQILNDHFGSETDGELFYPENTRKNSYSGEKRSPDQHNVSMNWTAQSQGPKRILVHCIGLNMADFIKEYKAENIIAVRDRHPSIISLYKSEPQWKTSGYVVSLDKIAKTITLYITALTSNVTAAIDSNTPPWLLKIHDKTVTFSCKIHQYWLGFEDLSDLDWTKIWKTFHAGRRITQEETTYFF